jgi:hypothetical protein
MYNTQWENASIGVGWQEDELLVTKLGLGQKRPRNGHIKKKSVREPNDLS